MKATIPLSLLLVVGVSLIAVNLGCLGIPEKQPDIEGIVTMADGEGILVEEYPYEEAGSLKAHITVTSATRVFYQQESAQTAEFDDISVGDRIRVWFTGPVRESYPVQATAKAIAILASERAP